MLNYGLAAVALGANMLEKTITEVRMTRSVEHVMSIEPNMMKHFVKTVRDLEISLGNGLRIMSNEELKKRDQIRRSIFLVTPGKKGQKISDCKIDFRRPGHGISPDKLELILDCKLLRDIKKDEMLKLSDIS